MPQTAGSQTTPQVQSRNCIASIVWKAQHWRMRLYVAVAALLFAFVPTAPCFGQEQIPSRNPPKGIIVNEKPLPLAATSPRSSRPAGNNLHPIPHAAFEANVPSGDVVVSINGTAQNGGGSIDFYTPSGIQSSLLNPLDRPRGVAFDNAGDLYIAVTNLDSSGNYQGTIFEINSAGTMSTITAGFTPNFFLAGLVTDSAGDVFSMAQDQTDPNLASTIFKITSTGTITTFGSVPGPGFGLAFDSAGNLYAADA